MKIKPVILLTSLLLISAMSVISQVNNKGVSVNNNQSGNASTNIHALIVGISKYQNVPGLSYADADAYSFYNFLISPAGGNVDSNNIKLLMNENATSANIFASLDWLLENVKEGETVLIYFSGHGDLETKTMMQNGFLLAADAPKSCYMAGGTVGLFYLQTYLNTLIDRNKAKVIMISDACKSGKLAGGVDGATNTMQALQQQWSNVVKILSSQAGELSQEGQKWGNGAGVFSFYLLNGLKGLADMNNDKKITLLEVFIYLSENVARETGNTQNPAIVGNQSTILAYVDSATLASVRTMLEGKQGEGQIAMKGFSDNVLKLLDPQVRLLYDRFQTCIAKGYLIEGTDSTGNAWDIYSEMSKMEGTEAIMSSVKRTLLAGLQNKSQIAINNWVKGEKIPDTISTYTAYYELHYAMQLIDSTYIMYDYIKARYLFWESVYTDDINEKLKIMQECVRIEPNAPFAYHQLGSIYQDLKDYPQAVVNYKKAHELAPGWTYPINDMGVAFDNMSNTDSAIWAYNLALSVDNMYPLAYNNLAGIYSSDGQYDTAMRLIDKAIGINPDRGLYYITKGVIFRNQELYDQALSLIQEGVDKEPDEADNYYQLGITYQYMENYPRAITNFKQAIQLNSQVAKYHKELARTYIYMEKYERGLTAIESSIALRPEDDENYSIMGMAYNYMGQYLESVKYYKKALNMDSTSAYNWRNLGRIYRNIGYFDESIDAGLKSIRLDSTNEWNFYYLSLAYNYAGRYTEAMIYADKALKLDPEQPDFETNLADIYRKSGDMPQAVVHFNKAITLDPDEPAYYNSLAYAYSENKEYDKAEENYMKCIKLDSMNPVRYIELADFYRDVTRNYKRAEKYFNMALLLDPRNYRIYEGLGYMYMRMEEVKNAEESFIKSIELAPNIAWNYYNLACLFSVNKNNKKAFEWLEKAFQKGMQDIEHIKVDPDMDPIRNTPEFKALVKKYLNTEL
jgi:tetratricopeptide (TPR) repeat protein